MKNNANIKSFEKYKINQPLRLTENRILKTNLANNNLSFEITNKYFKKVESVPIYPTIIPGSSKSNKNLKNIYANDEHFYPNNSKNYYYKDYYGRETYQPRNYQLYEDYSNHSNLNIRPFNSITKQIILIKEVAKVLLIKRDILLIILIMNQNIVKIKKLK